MKALVVYESLFGNTQQVARAVATVWRSTWTSTWWRSTSTRDITGLPDLIVVGGPTTPSR